MASTLFAAAMRTPSPLPNVFANKLANRGPTSPEGSRASTRYPRAPSSVQTEATSDPFQANAPPEAVVSLSFQPPPRATLGSQLEAAPESPAVPDPASPSTGIPPSSEPSEGPESAGGDEASEQPHAPSSATRHPL